MMARAWLELPLGDIARLGVEQYMGNQLLDVGDTTVSGRLRDLRPTWNAVRSIFFMAEAQLFDSEGASGDPRDEGIPWFPNGGEYGAWKAFAFGTPPNVLTGALMRQLTGQSGTHSESSGYHYIQLGSNAPVGEWSGSVAWPMPDDTTHIWTTDPANEDVGGLMAVGGSKIRSRSGDISEYTNPARPPISITEENVDDFVAVIMDYVTQAPLTRGWYNPGTRSWTGSFRRTGVPWGAPRSGTGAYRQTPSGRLKRARTT
jgi:hypothetical protein